MKSESDDQEYSHLPSFDGGEDVRSRRWMRSHGENECNGNQTEVNMPTLKSENNKNSR